MQTIDPRNVTLPRGPEYIRAIVDRTYVDELRVAMAKGWPANMPPVVVTEGDNPLVIDGVNRILAARAVGLKAVPLVVHKRTADDDLFVEQVKYNAAHGRRLTATEREHIVKSLRAKKWKDAAIAGLLQLSAASVSRIARNRQAQVTTGRRPRKPAPRRAPADRARGTAKAKVPEDKTLLVDFLDNLYRVLSVWSEYREALQPQVVQLDMKWTSLLRSLADVVAP